MLDLVPQVAVRTVRDRSQTRSSSSSGWQAVAGEASALARVRVRVLAGVVVLASTLGLHHRPVLRLR